MRRIYFRTLLLVTAALAVISACKKSSTENPKPEPPAPEPAYKVGDYYAEGFIKGIVIDIDDAGEHGMVISLNETEAVWSYKVEEAMGSLPGSGKYNTECVYKMNDWQNQYPAFFWCSKKNVGQLHNWFIPSMSELATLYKAYTGHETNDTDQGTGSTKASDTANKDSFNKCLTDNGGTPISDAVYWSSNESGPSIVWAFNMSTGTTITEPNLLDKRQKHLVRAFAEF